jgi:DNA mismatch repair protein MutS
MGPRAQSRAGADTPLMRQYREMKARHPDALLLFRVGDFYEMFCEDAEEGARLLGLTLTSRNNGAAAEVPLAGIPARALEDYLGRLLRLGRRVAICEQVEDPAEAKGIVRREVVETVSPGAVLSDRLLEARRPNHFAAIAGAPGDPVLGLAWADVSTGEFAAALVPGAEVASELGRLEVSELLLPQAWEGAALELDRDPARTYREDWRFDPELGREELARHYGVHGLEGFGVRPGGSDAPAVAAAGALLAHLREMQPAGVRHLRPLRMERGQEALVLDDMTRRNLELVEPLRPEPGARALLDVLDETLTPMGARRLRAWCLRPLAEVCAIRRRLDAVQELFDDRARRTRVRECLRGIADLDRLAARAAAGRATPRDLLALGRSLDALPDLRAALGDPAADALRAVADALAGLDDVADLLRRGIDPDAPPALGEGRVIREGYAPELDELRRTRDGAVDFIAALQARERARTGIASLKVGYNKVFGYYLEVTRPNLDRVPPDYERRQTLANAERFVTPELREWEAKVLTAEERIAELEARLFREIRERVGAEVARIQTAAAAVAELDTYAALAHVAERRGYVRPEVDDGYRIEIRGGRHPVVETTMPRHAFVPNDVVLDRDERVWILTGPNMAGKSTVLRQVGCIVVLAQMGSFVPADRARIGVVDRVFTRVGASDSLARGHSTFMVEMTETAAILNGATERSLVLLDEIGRGTSTYDGVSIAWAVTEYLHERVGAKTIFATHYHELTQITELLPAAVAYNVAVKEVGDRVVFLRRVERGGSDRSYGIHVARLAGLPLDVVARAREILRGLEAARGAAVPALTAAPHAPRTERSAQLSLFVPMEPPVVRKLRTLDTSRLTPLEALNLLESLRREAAGEGGVPRGCPGARGSDAGEPGGGP